MVNTFSNEFLSEIKTALEAQLVRIQAQLAEMTNAETGSTFPDYGDGEDEDAEEVAAYDANIKLNETLGSELRDTKEALARLDKGEYGVCKYCKNPIDEQRLRARPTSSSCIACKKALTQEL